MSEKSNCAVCGTSFAFRKGKLYCSDSCKTKAHGKRKNGLPVSGEAMRPKGSLLTFDVAEMEKVNKLMKGIILPFDVYCFFRKNLPTQLPVEKIAAILDEYYNSGRIEYESGNVDTSLQSAFGEFQKNFFAGTFEIIDTSPVAAAAA